METTIEKQDTIDKIMELIDGGFEDLAVQLAFSQKVQSEIRALVYIKTLSFDISNEFNKWNLYCKVHTLICSKNSFIYQLSLSISNQIRYKELYIKKYCKK
jgi:hypothetical protein